jgi:hypothetical protein
MTMTLSAIFVLLLVVAVPNTATTSGAVVAHHFEFKSMAECERFRDTVTSKWKGGSGPTAWGVCVEKPL